MSEQIDYQAFRNEIQAFVQKNCPQDIRQLVAENRKLSREPWSRWQKILHQHGWGAPNWPTECGGTGWNPKQQAIYGEVLAENDCPAQYHHGLRHIGPVLIEFGSPEQKSRYLPGILDGSDWWCQGYSEPNAGSDLASLKTRGEIRGDTIIVNGQKTWTTLAQHADMIFCLVRTATEGRKQEGISFLLIDMKSEGIKVNPIVSIDNHHSLNEVEFNNVRVPVENLIGEQDKGWTYAKALLAHERTGIANVADSKSNLANVIELARREAPGGVPLIEDADFQRRLSDIETELMALEYTKLRVLASVATGGAPGPESSLLKIKGTEIQQAVQELRMELSGYYMGVLTTEGEADVSGHEFGDFARRRYMYGRASTIYGGSNEIQKNIISKAVLGL